MPWLYPSPCSDPGTVTSLERTIEGLMRRGGSAARSGPSRFFGCYSETFIAAPCFWRRAWLLALPGFPPTASPAPPRPSRCYPGWRWGPGSVNPALFGALPWYLLSLCSPQQRVIRRTELAFLPERWWEASAFLALLSFFFFNLGFVWFDFISLLPALSRKPLLLHLQGICFFTQRAPGGKESKTNPTPNPVSVPGNPRLSPLRVPGGQEDKAGAGVPCGGGGAMPRAQERGEKRGGGWEREWLWRIFPPSCYRKAEGWGVPALPG